MKVISTDIFSKHSKTERDIDKYLKFEDFIDNNKELDEYHNFLKSNVGEIIDNFSKYKKILLRGDVQSGKTNNIIYLINEMIEKKNIKIFLYCTGRMNDLNQQNLDRISKAFKRMNKKVETFNAKGNNANYLNIGKLLERNDAVIISGIKRVEFINSFSLACKSLNIDDPVFIDDESDDTSLSFNFYSSVNSFIEENKSAKYIQITATPYKNLYNFQSFYDLYKNLNSPITYTGLKSFLNKYKSLSKSHDKTRFFQPLLHFVTTTLSLKLNKAEMLVSVTDLNAMQKKSQKELMENIKLLKSYIRSNDQAICNAIRNKGVELDEVISFLGEIYGSIFIYNGDGSNSTEEYRKKRMKTDIKITIGGISLSRGLTFSDLITQVIIKYSENEKFNSGDIMQRSRWFGHRKFADSMKIYMNDELISAYKEMEQLDDMVQSFQLETNFKEEFRELNLDKIEDPIYERGKNEI